MYAHRKWLVPVAMFVVILALGACANSGSTKAVAKHPAVAYRAPAGAAKPRTDPVELAATLGCADPAVSTLTPIAGFPLPAQHVDCDLAGGELTVNTFTAADMAWWREPLNQAKYCKLLERVSAGPVTFYGVYGTDFTAHIEAPGGMRAGSRAQADALGRALGLPVVTVCAG